MKNDFETFVHKTLFITMIIVMFIFTVVIPFYIVFKEL